MSGAGDDARSQTLVSMPWGFWWGSGWPLDAGAWCFGVPRAVRWYPGVLLSSSGVECLPSQREAPDCPVVVCWWSQGVVVVLVGILVLPAWPHALAGGLVCRPFVVPEPP